MYYVYEYVNTPDYPYWDYEPYATFTTDANGHAELSKKLSPNDYVTFEAVAPKGYCADSKIHKFTITKDATLNVVDDPVQSYYLFIRKTARRIRIRLQVMLLWPEQYTV